MSVESEIVFESTTVRTEVIRWYSVQGAPHIITLGNIISHTLSPVSAKFIFVDGEFTDVQVFGRIVKMNGEVSDRTLRVSDVYVYNQKDWPDWLKRLRDLAFAEFQESQRKKG